MARSWLIGHDRDALPDAAERAYTEILARRLAGEPIAYIVGRREFFGMEFLTTPAVLIPRPETEHLIDAALVWARGRTGLRIADFGTGSGAIAVTLAAHLPEAQVWAVDRSAEALAVARQNAARYHLQDRITFAQGDLEDWGGGGYFTGTRTYWRDSDHRCMLETKEVRRDLTAAYPQIWHDRWAEAGWRFREELGAAGDKVRLREKDLPGRWILRFRPLAGYELEHTRSKRLRQFPGWEWAEFDRNRLVWAEKGCLFTADFDRKAGIRAPTLLHGFNDMKFEERKAPY